MHLAYRWFTGLGFDQEVPHHSTFSKNRHGRFQESPLFLDPFERVVQQCREVGLLKGADLLVDSTQISADASPHRAISRDQLVEAAKVNRTVREYVEQVERENVVAEEPEQASEANATEEKEEPKLWRRYRNSPPLKISLTDPESALSSKRGASEFAYYDNYLVDSRSCVIAGVVATPARLSQEIVAARQMLERAKERFGLRPVSVTADKSYGTGEFLSWLSERQIALYIPVLDRKQQTNGFYTQHEFTRVPEERAYRRPAGASLNPSVAGQAVTFSATVKESSGTPTGHVSFQEGSTTLGTGTLTTRDGAHVAKFTISALTSGSHAITATYSGDTNFNQQYRASADPNRFFQRGRQGYANG
jgi:hypothetical protein